MYRDNGYKILFYDCLRLWRSEPMQLFLFQRLWGPAQRMPLKQLFPKQTYSTELTNVNTRQLFFKKIVCKQDFFCIFYDISGFEDIEL